MVYGENLRDVKVTCKFASRQSEIRKVFGAIAHLNPIPHCGGPNASMESIIIIALLI